MTYLINFPHAQDPHRVQGHRSHHGRSSHDALGELVEMDEKVEAHPVLSEVFSARGSAGRRLIRPPGA